jgi:hypothetical protein
VGVVDNAIERGSVQLMEAAALETLFTSLHEAGYRIRRRSAGPGMSVW